MNNISIFTTDTNLIIKSWGNWLETITNKPAATVCGKHLITIIPEIETRNLLHYFQEVITEGTVKILSPSFHHYLIDCPPVTPSQYYEKMQQRVTIAPWWENAMIIGTIVTIEDLTPRLEADKNKQSHTEKNSDNILSTNITKLGDENWRIRQQNVQEILEKDREKNHIKSLINVLKNEHFNASVLNSILQVLALSQFNAVDPLSELLKDHEDDLRIYAALALGEQHHPSAIPPLIEALKDENTNVKYHAIDALGKLKATTATDELIKIIQTQDFFLAYPAIESLEKIGDRSIASALIPLLTDELLSEPAAQALNTLADQEQIIPLADLINQPELEPHIIEKISQILATVYKRYQRLYGEGEQISNIVAAKINNYGLEQLLKTLPKTKNQENLVLVLTWLENTETTLVKLLSVANLRVIILENFADKGVKITDLLVKELTHNQDLDTQIAIVQCLGIIKDKKSVPRLLNLLNKNEPELIITIAHTLGKIGDDQATEPLISLLTHPEIRVRQTAIAAITTLGHHQLSDRLISLLQNPHPLIRESALHIAGHFRLPQTVELILQACEDQNPRVKKAALENLPHLEHSQILPTLLKYLESENHQIATSAVKALGYIDSNTAQPYLIKALDHSDEWVRYYAIRAIGRHDYQQFMTRLITIIQQDQSIPVRSAAIEVLGQNGRAEIIEILEPIALNTTEYNELVRSSIFALGNIPKPQAQEILLKVINNKYPQPQRLDAIFALGTKNRTEIADNLQMIAALDQDPMMIEAVIKSLVRLDNNEGIQALIELTGDRKCRDLCIKELAQMGEHIQTIAKGLQHPSPLIRESIVEVLTRTKHIQTPEILTSALSDQDSSIRLAVINALAYLNHRQADAQLAQIAHHDPDIAVRRAAFKIIN
jgi:HEAT repeat protein